MTSPLTEPTVTETSSVTVQPSISRGVVGSLDDEDPEPTSRERRPRAGHERPMQRVGVVGDEHRRWVTVLAVPIVHQAQLTVGH